ncbi:MAG: outer membrane beta-barrel protein [Deltaproteobacteria bacterium]|nr:outer membrane beta-barrel protein [Deltaproteobacteria bacterium]
MKKFFTLALALAVVALATSAQAEEKFVAGGFEASGHVVTGFGYQHQFSNAHPGVTSTAAGMVGNSDEVSTYGVLGQYLGSAQAGKQNQFAFFLDEVEVDFMKSFGENIRIRTDLDFGRATGLGGVAGSDVIRVEQAYATANLPLGNGVEFLVGRFNTPMGFESVDTTDNDLISKTALIRSGARPSNTTGAKLYYAFNDRVDLHFYVVNTIGDGLVANGDDMSASGKAMTRPSAGMRLGFNWGEEGNESTIGVSPFAGFESAGDTKKLTFGGDIDWNWWVNESFAVGGEGLFRRDSGVAGAPHAEILGGLLNLHYAFSDVWDGTLRYAFTKQFDFSNLAAASAAATNKFLGFMGYSNEISLGGAYAVADGAKVKLEGRFDWVKDTTSGLKSYDFGGALAFAYNF